MYEICRRLGVQKIHLRAREDPMLAEFLSDLDVGEVYVEVPPEIKEFAEPLVFWQESIVDRERMTGKYVLPVILSK